MAGREFFGIVGARRHARFHYNRADRPCCPGDMEEDPGEDKDSHEQSPTDGRMSGFGEDARGTSRLAVARNMHTASARGAYQNRTVLAMEGEQIKVSNPTRFARGKKVKVEPATTSKVHLCSRQRHFWLAYAARTPRERRRRSGYMCDPRAMAENSWSRSWSEVDLMPRKSRFTARLAAA